MNFNLKKSISILKQTPKVLNLLLKDLEEDWTLNNEGENTWSPFDIVGHLIHGEKTDWIPRAKIILSNQPEKEFESFDRFAQFKNSKGKSLNQLLNEFEKLRAQNLELLISFNITESQLSLTGQHPELGIVKLSQLLATWVTHDLGHLAQISRVMAKQYKNEVGPWTTYINILSS